VTAGSYSQVQHLSLSPPAPAEETHFFDKMRVLVFLNRMVVLVQTTADDVTEQRSSDASEVLTAPDAMAHTAGTQYLVVIDSQTVASNAAQLLQISSQAAILESAIASLHTSLGSMQKSWKDAWDHMSGKLQTFEQGLQAHGSCSTPESELLTCVASGCASPSLQQFLSVIREQGIRRWEKAMDSGCSNIQQLVTKRMVPVVQALIFRAGEMHGLARWDERFLPVGLGEGAVESLLREGERMLHKLTEVAAMTRSFHKGLGLLCHWLEKLTLRLLNDTGSTCISSDHALAIAKFIRAHLCHNRVGALLEGSESCAPFPSSHEDENPNAELLVALNLAMPSTAKVSLATQLERLKDSADFAFGETKHCISSKLPIDASIRLGACPPSDDTSVLSRVAMRACGPSATNGGAPLFLIAMRHDDDEGQVQGLCMMRLSPIAASYASSAPSSTAHIMEHTGAAHSQVSIMCACAHIHTHTYTHTNACARAHTHTDTQTHTHTPAYTHIRTRTRTHIRTHTHTRARTQEEDGKVGLQSFCAYTQACAHTHTHTHASTHAYTRTHTRRRTHAED